MTLVFKEPPQRATTPKPAPKRKKARRVLPPRTIAPDSHRPHGSYAKYKLEHCGCEPCTLDNRRYVNARSHAINRPDEVWMPYVAAGPVRRHVRMLNEFGIGNKTIAKLAGVPYGSMSKLIYGDPKRKMRPSRRVRPETARKILSVRPVIDNMGPRVPVPSAQYLAMIDDLVARGFTKTWIAQRIHHPGAKGIQLGGMVNGKRNTATIGAGAAVKIRDLYASLEGQTGPGRRSRWDNRRDSDA